MDEGDVIVDVGKLAPAPQETEAQLAQAAWAALCAKYQRYEGAELRAALDVNQPTTRREVLAYIHLIRKAEDVCRGNEAARGRLDQLYAEYVRGTTKDVRAFQRMRTVKTLHALYDRGVAPADLARAISRGRFNDLVRINNVGHMIYWPGWGTASAKGAAFALEKANGSGTLMGTVGAVAFGGAAGDAVVRAGGLGRYHTKEVIADGNGGLMPYNKTWEGMLLHCLDFLPFAFVLFSITFTQESDSADPADNAARSYLRFLWNGLSTVGVALYAFLMPWLLDRLDTEWLDADDTPAAGVGDALHPADLRALTIYLAPEAGEGAGDLGVVNQAGPDVQAELPAERELEAAGQEVVPYSKDKADRMVGEIAYLNNNCARALGAVQYLVDVVAAVPAALLITDPTKSGSDWVKSWKVFETDKAKRGWERAKTLKVTSPSMTTMVRGLLRGASAVPLMLGRKELANFVDPLSPAKGNAVADASLLTWGFPVQFIQHATALMEKPAKVEADTVRAVRAKQHAQTREIGAARHQPVAITTIAPAQQDGMRSRAHPNSQFMQLRV
ncbi:MAG TPA: hypothetical protein VLJ86_15245 [Ramlibacter sp.]|nr:hypothetical protein [Ramlibacter sp.]